MIGQTISHYKILEKLGEGGMGVVYKARDTRLDRMVAIKFLPPHLSQEKTAKQRFVQEAKAASAIDHPNIGTVYEIDEIPEGQIFIAMAYCEGGTLAEKLDRGRLDFGEASDIVLQIAGGLAEAHEKGIVHRDIKPSNILITERGRAVVIDFGLAKLKGQTRLTREGTTLGTTSYMSPEQARGDDVDHRTDIWSLGVLLQEMLTGRIPFKGEYDQAVIYSILNDAPEDITKSGADVPTGIEKIVGKALAKDPKDRYERIEAFAADLRELKDQATAKSKGEDTTREKHSIAVLPFVDMSPDKDQEYFCDGLAEELINALTHVKPLRVAARTSAFSFKGGDYDVREIGEKLNVDTVLEGSVRKAGDRLRITAQLVSAVDGYHLWSEKYDRNLEDIFAIQDEISLAIVGRLKIELLGEEALRLTKRGTEDLEAYDLYVRGRFFWEKRGEGLKKAIEYFKEAIEKDPKYAAPYAGIADSYNLLAFYGFLPAHDAMPKAREYARKALEIDDTIAEAHVALAWNHQYYDWDFTKAEQEFKRAIELNPAYTPAHYWYSSALVATGRLDDAQREIERAITLDPLSVQAYTSYGWSLIGVLQIEQSIERLKRALELNPDYMLAHWLLGCNYYLLSRHEDALTELQRAVTLSDRNPWMISTIGSVYARLGKTSEARKMLAELVDRSKNEYVQAYFFAYLFLGLGDLDEALAWLEKSFEARDPYLIYPAMVVEFTFEDHKNAPRLQAFLEKVRREVIT